VDRAAGVVGARFVGARAAGSVGCLARRAVTVGVAAAAVLLLVTTTGCVLRHGGMVRGFFGPAPTRSDASDAGDSDGGGDSGGDSDGEPVDGPQGSGVSARCMVTWTDPSMAAHVDELLAERPGATICFRRPAVTGSADGAVSGAAGKILTGPPRQIMLHTTGYSFQDNQGGDNATISCGILHKTAGGKGTYDDPTTVAVPGHAGQGTETPCGTRFYVPKYQKYFIVEDTGATKYDDAHHIDIYVGGQDGSKDASYKCQEAVTTEDGSPTPAIVNPLPGRPVRPGPIAQGGGCHLS
jgi:3D (Asp-Asp-Asp) domain-containing protein